MREQSDSLDMFDISNLFDEDVLEDAGVKVYKVFLTSFTQFVSCE